MAGGRGPARPGSHATAGRDLDARRRPPSSSAMRANEDPGRRGGEASATLTLLTSPEARGRPPHATTGLDWGLGLWSVGTRRRASLHRN